MRSKLMPSIIGIALFLTTTLWGQTSAQTGANANGQASVQADKSGTQASGSVSGSGAAESNEANAGLAAGTTFNGTLVTALDSKKVKSGDQVVARTTENVKAQGKTVLPKGTKLIGHVTEASARAKGDSESALGIAFDHAVLKGGQEIPLNLTIQALASGASATSAGANDMDTMADTGAGMGTAGAARGGRGVVGGATSVAGGAVGSASAATGRVAGSADSGVNSTLNSTTGVAGRAQSIGGLNEAGQLTANSRGVFNLKGLNLNSATNAGAEGSVVTSAGKNVRLDSGTRMLLATQTATSTPSK
jgi:hypothetical protein